MSPVGPLIGCTPARSYATRLGIERRMSEINTGSKPAVGPPAAALPPKPPEAPAALPLLVGDSINIDNEPLSNEDCSLKNLSWFSSRTAVTALR